MEGRHCEGWSGESSSDRNILPPVRTRWPQETSSIRLGALLRADTCNFNATPPASACRRPALRGRTGGQGAGGGRGIVGQVRKQQGKGEAGGCGQSR